MVRAMWNEVASCRILDASDVKRVAKSAGESARASNTDVLISSTRFRRYVRELKTLNADVVRSGGMPLTAIDLAHAHLNGRAGRELRAAVDISALREIGAFFTGEALADAVVQRALSFGNDACFVDPSCGCGDLLLAAARRMEVERGLDDTLKAWGARLSGADLVPEFVDTARERPLKEAGRLRPSRLQ